MKSPHRLSSELGHDSKSIVSTEEAEGSASDTAKTKYRLDSDKTASTDGESGSKKQDLRKSLQRNRSSTGISKEVQDHAVDDSASAVATDTSSTDTASTSGLDEHHHHDKKDKKISREVVRRQMTQSELLDDGSEIPHFQTPRRGVRPTLPDFMHVFDSPHDARSESDVESEDAVKSHHSIAQLFKPGVSKKRITKTKIDREDSKSKKQEKKKSDEGDVRKSPRQSARSTGGEASEEEEEVHTPRDEAGTQTDLEADTKGDNDGKPEVREKKSTPRDDTSKKRSKDLDTQSVTPRVEIDEAVDVTETTESTHLLSPEEKRGEEQEPISGQSPRVSSDSSQASDSAQVGRNRRIATRGTGKPSKKECHLSLYSKDSFKVYSFFINIICA